MKRNISLDKYKIISFLKKVKPKWCYNTKNNILVFIYSALIRSKVTVKTFIMLLN